MLLWIFLMNNIYMLCWVASLRINRVLLAASERETLFEVHYFFPFD